ncbi:MAG: tetratricopeptide repeat protein, partial [Proteobacteria bacterium]|nr:tetratricopeptide repeat protein [Pseudomonadota bacterium]
MVLFLGAGVLYAQTGELKAYLERGRALAKAEKPEQALPYFLFALELGEKQFGADSPAVVPLLNDLAEVYATRSDYPDAEPLFKRSLTIQEQEVTRYRSGIARTLNSLGALYEATARPREARKLYRRVITILQPALGRDDPSVERARLRLAELGAGKPPPPAAEVAVAAPAAAIRSAATLPAAAPSFRVHLTSIRKAI